LNYLQRDIFIIGITVTISISLLDNFIIGLGDATNILIIATVMATLIGVLIARRRTHKGELILEGKWEDVGEFRILNINGSWKLGYHEGKWIGEMKDLRPTKANAP
jgi:hypothetical protein